jgi:hypothetical protein
LRRVNGLVSDTYAAGTGGGIITIQVLEAAGSDRDCSGPHDLKFSRPIAFVHGSEFIAASSHSIMSYGFKLHADVETLLETAIWTSFPLGFVNDTASFCDTIVHFLVLHSAFEKAFARLTSQKAIMVATHFVPAHRT